MTATPGHRLATATRLLVSALLAAPATGALAHDTWIQASQRLARIGDVVRVDLFLGNHGNDHRDFRVAGKLASLDGSTLAVIAADGRHTDLVPDAVDVGSTSTEGFWSARFVPDSCGPHGVTHTRTGIHKRKRGIKSGKAYFLVADALDAQPAGGLRHAEPLGHALEIVPETDPVLGLGAGRPIAVRLLFHGRPLADHRVSFIPRGAVLAEGFDPRFERRTDDAGRCSFEPGAGDLVLVVAHVDAPEERGPDFDRTVYSATLVLDVPDRGP